MTPWCPEQNEFGRGAQGHVPPDGRARIHTTWRSERHEIGRGSQGHVPPDGRVRVHTL